MSRKLTLQRNPGRWEQEKCVELLMGTVISSDLHLSRMYQKFPMTMLHEGCDLLIKAMGTNMDYLENKVRLVDVATEVGVKVYFPSLTLLSRQLGIYS